MSDELAIIEREQDKIAIKKRKADAAVLQQVLEPLEEAMNELTDIIKQSVDKETKEPEKQEYFDKDFGKNVILAIDKVFNLIKGFKQADVKIDLSPITAIAQEIKRGNDSILDLIKQSNSGNISGELFRMFTAMIGKQNALIEKGFIQIDYSSKIDSLIQAVGNKNNIEEINFVYGEGGQIKSAKPTYKK